MVDNLHFQQRRRKAKSGNNPRAAVAENDRNGDPGAQSIKVTVSRVLPSIKETLTGVLQGIREILNSVLKDCLEQHLMLQTK